MENIEYSSKQIDTLLSAVTILLPLSTGFILLMGAGFSTLSGAGVLKGKRYQTFLTYAFVLSVVSIGLYSGCVAFLVDCSRAFEQGGASKLTLKYLNIEWSAAIYCVQLGLLSFFGAVVCYSSVAYRGLEVLARGSSR